MAPSTPFADKENSNPFTPRAAVKPGLGALVEKGATPGRSQGLTPQRARQAGLLSAATPSKQTPAPAGEDKGAGSTAADALRWARKIDLERGATERLPAEKRHERLVRLYQEATNAIGAVRLGEGAYIWLGYAQLQAYAPRPLTQLQCLVGDARMRCAAERLTLCVWIIVAGRRRQRRGGTSSST